MQLKLAALLLLAGTAIAHADGEMTLRGVYYKERSTRVVQPMLDAMFEVGVHGLVTGHLLVDAITSASASSGASTEKPVAFTERRFEAGAGYAHELEGPDGSFLDVVRLGGEGKVSSEPDYSSFYAGVRAEAELAQKNATIGIGGGVSADTLDASGTQDTSGLAGGLKLQCPGDMLAQSDQCDVTTYSMFASVTHLLSKNALVGVSYDLAKQDGFLSNPYRSVTIAPITVPERHPYDRTRHAFAISARYFVPSAQIAIIAAYRFYKDSWDLHAHTPELRIIQQVGRGADASIRYRYYTQDAAFFFQERYTSSMITYVTDDPKMGAFDGHLLEAKLGMLGEVFGLQGRWAGARLEGILEYIIQHNRFGNAVVAHAALTVPFDY
jgi:hypothetical protein